MRHNFATSIDVPTTEFQYYKHDIGMLAQVIVESYRFTKAFEQKADFASTNRA